MSVKTKPEKYETLVDAFAMMPIDLQSRTSIQLLRRALQRDEIDHIRKSKMPRSRFKILPSVLRKYLEALG